MYTFRQGPFCRGFLCSFRNYLSGDFIAIFRSFERRTLSNFPLKSRSEKRSEAKFSLIELQNRILLLQSNNKLSTITKTVRTGPPERT